jgi:hypothetical protein
MVTPGVAGFQRRTLPGDGDALRPATDLGDLSEAIQATGSVSGELLGEPSAQIRASLADHSVRLFTPFVSM